MTLAANNGDAAAALAALREAYIDLEATRPLREIGRSVVFVNHEMKNFMMVISGYTALLQRSKTMDQKERAMVKGIAEAAAKLQDLSASISELSRSRAVPGSVELELAERLNLCVYTHFRDMASAFSLRCDAPGGAITVNGNPERLERAFAGIFRNSLEAGARQIGVRLSVHNYIALIAIDDDGEGCDAGRLPSLSETFFTTKQRPGGIGLGLCAARAIAETHGGNVSVYSKNLLGGGERGLSVQITLPASKKTPYTAAEAEVMLVREGLDDVNGLLNILKNLKIIPHSTDGPKDADFKSRSGALKLLVLAAASQTEELKAISGDNPAVKILPIEETGGGAFLVCGDGGKALFTEDYVIRSLCGA